MHFILLSSVSVFAEDEQPGEEPIKYPIDDLLVQPGADDPVFTNRPVPSRDFNVPIECVGDLLLVWDFCSSFGRLLHLLPYSLEDFENAICHKESNVVLLVEIHSALLRLLINDGGEYFLAVQKRNRKFKVKQPTAFLFVCCTLVLLFKVMIYSSFPTPFAFLHSHFHLHSCLIIDVIRFPAN